MELNKEPENQEQEETVETGEAELVEETPELELEELSQDEKDGASGEATVADEAEEKLKEIGKLLAESDQRYLRVAAEYDNFRKRTIKEKDAIYPQAQADTIAKILPVLDSFQRALDFESGTTDFSKGIELINQSFKDILVSMGVEAVGEVGEAFDPMLHNAILHIEDSDLGENVISQVLQKGYKIGERVIRHATVQTAN